MDSEEDLKALDKPEKQGKFKQFITIGIVGLLVLGLASFGILDFVNGGSDFIVKVDEKKVTPQAFSKFLDSQRKQYISRFGSGIIEALLNKKDFTIITANLMADQLLIAKELEKYGVIVNKDTVNKYILNLPEFQNASGTFDRNYYNTYLNQLGFSEEDFIMEQIPVIQAKLLMGVIELIDFSNQESLVKNLIVAMGQKREISIARIKVNSGVKSSSSEQEILNYYIKNKEQFAEDELREVNLSKIDTNTIKSMAVSKDRLLKEYEEGYIYKNQKVSFYKLTFSSVEEARRAESLIKNEGLAFTDVAEKILGLTSKEIYFKNVVQSELPPEFASRISKLSKFEVSDLFQSVGTYNLIKLDGVTRGKIPSFESVKSKIVASLGKNTTCASLETMAVQIAGELDSGETLKNSLEGKSVIQNITFSKSDSSLLPSNVVDAIMTDNDSYYAKIIKSKPCEYYAYQIVQIRPKTYKNIDEVKSIILRELQKKSAILAAQQKANGEYAKLVSGESSYLTFSEKMTVDRNSSKSGLTAPLLQQIFSGQQKGVLPPILSPKEDEVLIIRVDKINQLSEDKISSSEIAKTEIELRKMQKEELFRSYMEYLRTRYTVRINYLYLQGSADTNS